MSDRSIFPSVATKPTTIRKLPLDFAMRIPCCCTVWGSRGTASWTRFCTWTCAVSGSVPWAKVSWMLAAPSLVVWAAK